MKRHQVPKMEDFQFFNTTRVNALYEKEAAFLTYEFNRGQQPTTDAEV